MSTGVNHGHNGSESRQDYSRFRLSSPLDNVKSKYDVVVIGSGYGGAVAASRCARAGQRVCVLEKGKEWLPGDFPETESKAMNEVQMTVKGKKGLVGSPTGLYDMVIGDDVTVVQGCGLGGGSLINANVALDTDPRVFQDTVWPEDLRRDVDNLLAIDRAHVYDMLKPSPYPEDFEVLPKMEAMKVAADHIVKDIEDIEGCDIFKRAPLFVNFKSRSKNHVGIPQPACVGCGNCCGGCNTGAKNSLNMNYLPDAKAHGAEIFTQIEVRYIVRDNDQDGWVVHYVPNVQESLKMNEHIVRAGKVILAAGSLGSTNILMKSEEFGGLNLSSKLGQKFTANGDTLNFRYNGEKGIRPAGVKLADLKEGKAPGPAISAIIDLRNIPGDHFEDGLVLEDVTPPTSVEAPYKFLVSWREETEGTSPGENDWRERIHRLSGTDWKNTLGLLSMTYDKADGYIAPDHKNGRVLVEYPEALNKSNFKKVQQVTRSASRGLKGSLTQDNPNWHELVPKMKNKKGLVTVHPLGGCSMADSGSHGVVNHAGQVFAGDTKYLHPDLYIVDGAVVPRSLGVNPALTIAMMAERSIRIMAKKYGWRIDYDAFTEIDASSARVQPGLRFTERMRGNIEFGEESHYCEFLLTVETNDLERFLQDEHHSAKVHGTVTCKGLSRTPLTVSEGQFQLFVNSETVNTREMRYRMVLSSKEGKSYFIDGVKVVHKNSAFAMGVGDTTTLSINIHKGNDQRGTLVAKAKLEIKLKDFRRQLKTLEVLNVKTKLEKFKWKARFGKFFAGALWEVYGPLATTKNTFNPDALPREKRPLVLGDAQPVVTQLNTQDDYELLLTRFEGGSKGPLLLVHGTGVASSTFTIDTVDKNFVEFLVEREYDVWNLDWRASVSLDGCRRQWTCDDAGKYDIPLAVDHILETTGKADMQVVVHCAGGIVFFTSLLQGNLEGKIRSIICSQVGPFISGGKMNAFKSALRVPSLLQRVGVEGFAFAQRKDNWTDKASGTFFGGVAGATTAVKEHCNNPTCHRITFIHNLLWNHANLNVLTHNTLHETFGYVSSKVYRHFAKIVNKGHLVTFENEDSYLPGGSKVRNRLENEKYKKQMKYLDIPTMFCSGLDNKCWDPDTTKRSIEACREANPEQEYERVLIQNYAHLDFFMGKDAATEVYPLFTPFLEKYAYSSAAEKTPTPGNDNKVL